MTTSLSIKVEGANSLRRAFREMGRTDAPFVTVGMTEAGAIVATSLRSNVPRHLASKVSFEVRGEGISVRAVEKVSGPDAARQEFGRHPGPYRTNRRRGKYATYGLKKAGYHYRGSKARHFIERTKSETTPAITAKLEAAIGREFARLTAGGD